jgi:PAS domain-containing protein
VRHGNHLGAFVLLTSMSWGTGMPPSDWAALTVFSGMVALACANIEHTRQLNNQTRLLEALVTQRSRQMQFSRNVLRVIFDHLPEGVVLRNAGDRISAVNRAFAAGILGIEPREIVGQRYSSALDRLAERTAAVLLEQGLAPETVPPESMDAAVSRKRFADPSGVLHWYEVQRIEIASEDPAETLTLETWRVMPEDER